MTQNMWNVVIILGGITVFAGITLLDWLGRRKDRQSRNRAASLLLQLVEPIDDNNEASYRVLTAGRRISSRTSLPA